LKLTIFLFSIIFSLNATGEGYSPRNYEDELVIRLVKNYTDNGVVWLGRGKNTFLSLYTEPANPEIQQAAIILHGMGMHADWPELILPLRKQIPSQDWASLSVQLPLLDPQINHAEYGRTFKLANDRIRLAIRYLQNRGMKDIVIIGFGFGATTAINYLTTVNSSIKAMVGISMQPHQFLKPKYDLLGELSNIKIPLLDIYAAGDFSGVLKSVDDRRLAGSKGANHLYHQIKLKEAKRYFTGKDKELTQIIIEWLNQVIVE
jgi:hypothetical protein